MKKLIWLMAIIFFIQPHSLSQIGQTQKGTEPNFYTPQGFEQLTSFLRSLAAKNEKLVRLIKLGQSYGQREIILLELSAKNDLSIVPPESRPAILVTANLEGLHFLGTEAICRLAKRLIEGYGKDKLITQLLNRRTIYLAPLLNPDAYAAWFGRFKEERKVNSKPVDEDNDGAIDEDGPEDLNGDGYITLMRVKDPEGNYISDPKEPRLLRLADPKKGEKGIYKVYSEGLDNDGDGEINEDPRGGVEVNRNFPHDFEYFNKTCGLWPTSEPEVQALLKFITERRHIALILNFSSENTILNFQQTGQARVGADRVRIPRMYASMLGLDPDQEYSLKEIAEALRGLGIARGMEVTEEMVASFLGLGPAVAIDRQDLSWFEAIQKEYKDRLSKASIDYPERRAKGVEKGSFVAYAYYQYGVPVFSVDIWNIPEPKKPVEKEVLTPEKLKSMSSQEFISLGEEKIGAFLKTHGVPASLTASSLIEMVKSGKLTPARIAEMMEKIPVRPISFEEEHPEAYLLSWSDTALAGRGFVEWKSFKHPTLGEVEIGGFIPGIKLLPPIDLANKVIDVHIDFYLDLMQRVAEIQIKEIKSRVLSEGIYEIEVWLTNPGWFPTSTAQGRRALTSWPIRIKLNLDKENEIFSGQSVALIPFLNGSGEVKKVNWVIKGKKGSKVSVEAASPKLGKASASIILP
ncbi:MAG: M14 family metallopeptidase [Candidatus Aminicenantes bacterium]|nr:M14 family metallopeptidase [Candidatus Aminicenantes bacterium]